MNIDNFAQLLKYKRELKGYTITALANLLDVSASYISRLESDSLKQPSFTLAIKIANVLDISIEELKIAFALEKIKSEDIQKNRNIYVNDNLKNLNNEILRNIDRLSGETIDLLINLLNNIKNISSSKEETHKYILLIGEDRCGYAIKSRIINDEIKTFVADILSAKYVAVATEIDDFVYFEIKDLEEIVEMAISLGIEGLVDEFKINQIKKYL